MPPGRPGGAGRGYGRRGGGIVMEPKPNLFAIADGLTNGAGNQTQVSFALAAAIAVALVIFVTAFLLGVMCGWAWRRRA